MKIAKTVTLPNQDIENQLALIDQNLKKIMLCLQGRVSFGAGTDGVNCENIKGQWQVVADTGSANTNFSVTHTMGQVPVGYIVTKINNAGVIYLGTDAWTTTTVSLKSSAANSAVSLVLLGY